MLRSLAEYMWDSQVTYQGVSKIGNARGDLHQALHLRPNQFQVEKLLERQWNTAESSNLAARETFQVREPRTFVILLALDDKQTLNGSMALSAIGDDRYGIGDGDTEKYSRTQCS